jgi:hypothetical protein
MQEAARVLSLAWMTAVMALCHKQRPQVRDVTTNLRMCTAVLAKRQLDSRGACRLCTCLNSHLCAELKVEQLQAGRNHAAMRKTEIKRNLSII